MKTKTFLILVLALISQTIGAQEYSFWAEQTASGDICYSHNLKKDLAERGAKSEGTVIRVEYDNPKVWNPTEIRAIEYAARLWEEQLVEAYPTINILVKKARLNKGQLARTEWNSYCSPYTGHKSLAKTKIYQCCNSNMLVDDMFQNAFRRIFLTKPDITITITRDNVFYWGTDGDTPTDKYDAVTLFIREMAKGFELSNTIMPIDETYKFSNDRYRLSLESLLKNSANKGNDMNAFVACDSIAVGSFVFAGTPTFVPGETFFYLTENSARLNDCQFLLPKLPKGASFHNISNKLREFMEEYLNMRRFHLVGEGEPDISSSANLLGYNSVTDFDLSPRKTVSPVVDELTLSKNANSDKRTSPRYFDYENLDYDSIPVEYWEKVNCTESLTEYGWRLELLRNDGRFITVKRQSGYDRPFTIRPSDIPDTTEWARNADGYLRGRVYHLILDGRDTRPCYQYIYLDYLPSSPQIEAITSLAEYEDYRYVEYIPKIAFNAVGATRVELRHECEDGIITYDLSPDCEYYELPNADPYIENEFTITAINKNGQKKSKTVIWGGEGYFENLEPLSFKLEASRNGTMLNIALSQTNEKIRVRKERVMRDIYIIKLDSNSIVGHYIVEKSSSILDVSRFLPGVYAINVVDDKGFRYSAKILL